MKPYEFLDHTSEIKIVARGESLEEAFENTAKASFEVMTDITKIKAEQELSIQVEADTEKSLLYDFLDHLIFLLDTEAFLLKDLKDTSISLTDTYTLRTTLIGDTQDTLDDYDVTSYIKSPTYSEMAIQRNGHVEITYVPDI